MAGQWEKEAGAQWLANTSIKNFLEMVYKANNPQVSGRWLKYDSKTSVEMKQLMKWFQKEKSVCAS